MNCNDNKTHTSIRSNPFNQGWLCPKCGRINSPITPTCPCYYEKNTTLSNHTSTHQDLGGE